MNWTAPSRAPYTQTLAGSFSHLSINAGGITPMIVCGVVRAGAIIRLGFSFFECDSQFNSNTPVGDGVSLI